MIFNGSLIWLANFLLCGPQREIRDAVFLGVFLKTQKLIKALIFTYDAHVFLIYHPLSPAFTLNGAIYRRKDPPCD